MREGILCCCLLCAVTCCCDGCSCHRRNHPTLATKARQLLNESFEEIIRLSRKEKKQLLLTKLNNFAVTVTPKGYWKIVLLVGRSANVHEVCRRSFCYAYSIGHTLFDDLVSLVKSGAVNCESRVLCRDRAIPAEEMSNRDILQYVKRYGVSLSPVQMGSLRLKNSAKSSVCAAWMQYYFTLIGDQVITSTLNCCS